MSLLLLAFGVGATAYLIVSAIYKLYLHPLSSFPGPSLWSISKLPYMASLWKGFLHVRIKEIHDQYGPVVRIGPNELSFIKEPAWKHIYAGGPGNKGFPKHAAYINSQSFESLFDASNENHSRLRKLLKNNFFSAAAVSKQEPIIHFYTTDLVEKLKSQIHDNPVLNLNVEVKHHTKATVNIQEWFNFATFDMAGKLTVDEDFGCLRGLAYHPWIMMVLTHFQISALVMCLRIYSPLDRFLIHLAPPSLLRLREKFLYLARDKVKRRLERTSSYEENDFVSVALKNPKNDGLNQEELEANCMLMMLAASETMATSLLSATNYLCKNPRAQQRLSEEIRKFKSEGDLILANLQSSTYLNAVIRETHRLCPPLSNGPARVVGPKGAQINGNYVPAGISIGVTQYAAFRSAANFSKAEEFVPERWLKEENSNAYSGDQRGVVQPFSVGGRDCIGQNFAIAQFRIVLARMVWNFNISPKSDHAWESQKAYMLWKKEPFFVDLSLA